jgi:transposase InsO family protein
MRHPQSFLSLFDRKVIGWALSGDMESGHTVVPVLEMAVGNRAASPGLVFHSDRGVQYCSKAFRELPRLRCPSVRQSMSRKGNWYHKRWGIETKYQQVKQRLELENFSRRLVDNIRQDFYAMMTVSNMLASFVREANREVRKEGEKRGNKYEYQVNVNHTSGRSTPLRSMAPRSTIK